MPFSEWERLLCETMFWLSRGKPQPVGIHNVKAFLDELCQQAFLMWQACEFRKGIVDQLVEENRKLRDQVYELEMRH
jgi:hypothetical protein